MECVDFLEFQDVLKKMRDVDDKIVYALNANVPTPSFRNEIDPTEKCKELYSQLSGNYEKRESAIKGCIRATAQRVQELKDKRDSGDSSVTKQLSQEQTKLRLLRSELNVEEVVMNRSLKIYYERCRQFYKPPEIK